MKTKVLLLLTMLFAVSIQAQKRVNGARVGYIDMEYILENVTAYQEANTQLEAKANRWKAEMQKKQGEIEQMKKNLSAERVLLTKELVDEREEEIQILEEELIKYQQDRFGPNGSLMIQRQNLVKPIQDQVLNAVQEIAKKRRYDFVFDKSADVVMLYSAKKFDISDLVLRTINREVKREGRAAKLKEASEKSKFDDEKEVNPEVEAKKQAAAEKKAERQKVLEERKQKRLEEREAKKKAYEEKRKKLIADREAKKKAAEEKRKKRAEDKKKKDEERKKQQEENKNEEENEGSGAGNGE
ncbi:OmpH family outer membrane protein [uncultured Kordia sp.]|uniref:OmpH family outer membrane protein n=1 Tax=uncultured Kordia sp. TaxID=507699 RepID=UPI00261AA3B3|nr:OmpH family outer membrane protein [uncultured Kordia sp.]